MHVTLIRRLLGQLKPVQVQLKTYDTTRVANLMKGTIRWRWKDDNGNIETFDIPNSFYDPKGS